MELFFEQAIRRQIQFKLYKENYNFGRYLNKLEKELEKYYELPNPIYGERDATVYSNSNENV